MDKNEIPFLSVSQLSQVIKDRSVSPVEIVESYLDRIDSLRLLKTTFVSEPGKDLETYLSAAAGS